MDSMRSVTSQVQQPQDDVTGVAAFQLAALLVCFLLWHAGLVHGAALCGRRRSELQKVGGFLSPLIDVCVLPPVWVSPSALNTPPLRLSTAPQINLQTFPRLYRLLFLPTVLSIVVTMNLCRRGGGKLMKQSSLSLMKQDTCKIHL